MNLAHLHYHRGRLSWSGYHAEGDPQHRPWAFVVDVGREFLLTSDEPAALYLIGPGPQHFGEFTPTGLLLAARSGMFGFKLLESSESKAIGADKARQKRKATPLRERLPVRS